MTECRGTATLDTDTVLGLLSSSRRRAVITSLERSEERDFDELIDALAEIENDVVTEDARKTVHVSLLQTHLPKLDDHDAVVWHRDDRFVERGVAFEQLHETLRCVEQGTRSDSVVDRLRSIF